MVGFNICTDMATFNCMVYLGKLQPEFQVWTYYLWAMKNVNQGGGKTRVRETRSGATVMIQLEIMKLYSQEEIPKIPQFSYLLIFPSTHSSKRN